MSNTLNPLEEELQKLLDIQPVYMCQDEDNEITYWTNPDEAFDNGYDPITKCYIPLTGDDYLYFMLVMSSIVEISTLSHTYDLQLFKTDILSMCMRYLKLLKEVDKENYNKLYNDLRDRILEGTC